MILRMLSLGLGDIEQFPFLEPPDSRAVADGWQQLGELGAVDIPDKSGQRKLTAIGWTMAKLPVDVKPVSYTHLDVYKRQIVDETLDALKEGGSVAAPGFMKPEGVIVFLTASRHLYKVLAENDNEPKGKAEAA